MLSPGPGKWRSLGGGSFHGDILWKPWLSTDSAPPGSQRYVVMRTAEMQQLKDHSHGAVSNPAFGKTVRDLPL